MSKAYDFYWYICLLLAIYVSGGLLIQDLPSFKFFGLLVLAGSISFLFSDEILESINKENEKVSKDGKEK